MVEWGCARSEKMSNKQNTERQSNLRKTGIEIIGNVPWGTHLCHFYQTEEDLTDILVPYFKAGLENNEFCMWVTSEPASAKEAKAVLQKAVSNLDDYIKKGQIEILDYSDWYIKSGKFDSDNVLAGWLEKEKEAIGKGFEGLRLTGNTFWLKKNNWRGFADYEAVVNNVIGQYRMLAICSYSLDKCGAGEIVDVVSNHQFALIREAGKWIRIENSERKKAEEELKRTENKYRTLVEHIPQKIFVKDTNSVYLSCNELYATDLKMKPYEIIGKTDYEFYPKDLAEKYRKDDKRIMESGTTEDIEEQYIQNGQETWVHTVKTPLKDQKGNIIGVMGIFRDITEHKKAEEALQENLRGMEAVVETAPSLIVLTDPDGHIIMFNRACEELTGYKREEVLGKTIPELFLTPEWVPIVQKRFADPYAPEVRAPHENPWLTKSGDERLIEWRCTVLPSPEGGRPCVLGIGIDMTERKRAEERLKDSEDRYRKLFENATDGIALADTETGIILDCNKAMEGLVGREKGELIGQSQKILHPPEDDIGEVCRTFAQHRHDKEGQILEAQVITKTGERKQVEIKANVFELKGRKVIQGIFRDITERKQTKKALEESEKQLRLLFQKSPIGIGVVRNGITIFANEAYLSMFGYDDVSEIKGTPYLNQVAPQCREEISQRSRRRELGQTGPDKYETMGLRMDGSQFHLHVEAARVELFGEMTTIAFLTDVSELKRAEDALRKSEVEAKRLAEENAVMAEIGRIISSTLNIEEVYERFAEEVHKLIQFDRIVINIIDEVNKSFTISYAAGPEVPGRKTGDTIPLAGTGSEEILRTRASLLVQSENQEELIGRFPGLWPLFRVGFQSIMLIPLLSRDQVIGVLNLQSFKSGAFSKDDIKIAERVATQIAGAIANAQLFLERKRAEAQLKGSEEHFRFLIENSSDIITTVDSDGNISYISPSIEPILGYSPKSLYGKNGFGYIHPDDLQLSLKSLSKMLQDSGTIFRPIEHRLKHHDGSWRVFQSIGRAILDDSGNKKIIINSRDVTENKKTEHEMADLQEQVRLSQRMEAIGRLAGGIAHDFNNLLTIIKGHSQLPLMVLKKDDPLRENFMTIMNSSDRASILVRQLLAFSRRQVMEIRVLDLNTLLRDLDKMLRRVIGEDIELVTVLPDDLGRVKTDPGQIEQVIMNLVVNARDAMPSGGKLTIETANVELDEEYARRHVAVKPGPYVMISVSDTGVGMTPEVKERVFEPFFTTKEIDKGTGLGLSTVYGIVKQSGGNIWVYSEPGQGATFKIYLPRVDEPIEEARKKVVEEKFPRGSETVLVAEDDEAVRRLAVQILERQGYKVLEVSQGDDAFPVCEKHKGPIHLLLTDVVMPGMSGRDLAKRLASLHPEMKVLYMSGYTDNAIVHHGVLGKEVNYIQKPFTVDGFACKVREVLDASRREKK